MLAASQVSRPSGKLPLVIDEHPPVAVLVNDTVPPVTRYVPPHLPRASRALCRVNVRPRTVHVSVRPGTRRVPVAVPTYDLANLGPSAALEPASAGSDVATTASTAIVVPVVSMFRITVSPRSLGGDRILDSTAPRGSAAVSALKVRRAVLGARYGASTALLV